MRQLHLEALEDRQLLSVTLPTINDVSLAAGTTAFVALPGSSDISQPVHYSVTVSDYSKLTPVMMPSTNKTIEFQVNINGTDVPMDFQLLNNLAPNTAQAIENLVSSGYYNGLEIYRNSTTDPLVLQGGNDDPTNGPIKSTPTVSSMAEEFNPNLQYTSGGLLAMVRTGTPSTSSSEFFITEDGIQNARSFMDYNYTIFGVQTAGSDVVSQIAAMADEDSTQDPNGLGYLQTPVTIDSASIVTDTQNGVLELVAPKTATSGTVTVTVTADDGDGTTPATQTFNVTLGADSSSNPANPWATKIPAAPTGVTFLPPGGGTATSTILDNSTPDQELTFQISGVTAGNKVELLCDGNVIPTTVTSTNGTTVTVQTDGITALSHTPHEFTAIQIAPSQTVGVTESGGSTPINETADVPSVNSLATPLTVANASIGLGPNQNAATNKSSATFVVTFSEPVTEFDTTNVTYQTNFADSTTFKASSDAQISITPAGSASQYTVTVTGMDQDGNLVFNIPADTYTTTSGAAVDAAQATVIRDTVPPTETVALASGQSASTVTPSAAFLVTFSEPVTNFTATSLSATNLAGSTGFSNLAKALFTVTPTGTANQFTVTVTGMDETGTVVFALPTSSYTDAAGNSDTVNTSATGTATVNYYASKTFMLSFAPPAISESDGSNAATGTITVAAAPTTDLTVYLTSSNTAQATVPTSVTIPAGQLSATFAISAVDDGIVETSPSNVTITASAPGTGYLTGTGTLSVANTDVAKALTVNLNPSTIAENAGANAATGTITIPQAAPAGGLTVYLYSSNTAQATVPTSVTIPAGQTSSAPFYINAVDDGIVESSPSSVTITASASGYTLGTSTLTVTNTDVAKAITVSVNPPTFAENAGSNVATGTVSIPLALTSDLVLTLTSSNTLQATVPVTVTIPAGQLSATFAINAVDDGIAETSPSSVTITATAAANLAYTPGTTTVSVLNTDAVKTLTVNLNPSTIAENAGANAATGTVTVPEAPTSDLVVTLTSSNTSQATVLGTVTIKAGSTSASFYISAVDDGIAEASSSSVTITATASGYTLGTSTLTVTNTDVAKAITVSVNPSTFAENVGSNAATGVVSIPVALSSDLVITLSSSNTLQATVPVTVTIPAGQLSATFTINAVDDHVAETSPSSVTITATVGDELGYTPGTTTVTVLNSDAVKALTVNLNPSTIAENAGINAATGTISIPQPAPTGGLTVTLTSNNTSQATVPTTVTIPAGATSVSFYINAVDDGIAESSANSVTIIATASGYTLGTSTLTVNNTDVAKAIALTVTPGTIEENGGTNAATGTIVVSVAPTADLTIYLTSSNTAQATVPTSVIIPAGQTSATFAINAVDNGIVDSGNSVTITAYSPGSGYAQGTTSFTVANTDVAKTISVTLNPGTITESDGANAATGTVTVPVAPTTDLVIKLTSSDTLQATVPATVTIKANTTSATFAINAVDDGQAESSASSVIITATEQTSGLGYAGGTATLSVTNTDITNGLTVVLNPVGISENEGAKAATGTVSVQTAPTTNLTITLVSSNTAQATVPATVTILAGHTSATFPINAVDDGIVETANTTLAITASASVAGYTPGQATLTVLNTDAVPTLSIADVTNYEGSGKNGFIFTVTLSAPSSTAVTVTYTTVDGTATSSGANPDYEAKSGTLTIPAGETSGSDTQINVPVLEDDALTTDKTFYVELTGASGATIARVKATGTIVPAGAPLPPPVVTPTTPVTDTVGVYNPATATFTLSDGNQAGAATETPFVYGKANAGWIPIAGDWDGNGTVTEGMYNPATSTFYLKNSMGGGSADVVFQYGPANAGWIPVAGDWDGDGRTSIGLYNPVTSTFYLRNSTSLQGSSDKGYADVAFQYGPGKAGWVPVVGDWNGDGKDTVGLYNPTKSIFLLRNSDSLQGAGDHGYADITFAFGAPGAGWKPIAGDWNADGSDGIGLYNATLGKFYLRDTTSLESAADLGYADNTFTLAGAGVGMVPLAGAWNGPANAELAAGGAVTPAASLPSLTQAQLQPIINEALARWASAGVDASAMAKLSQAQFVIGNLPGAYLGEAVGNVITIDNNAAGRGWFVDPTPTSDSEFGPTSSAGQSTAVDPRATDRIDLLTVVEHELGHLVGLSDIGSSTGDLMSRTLSEGVRRDVSSADAAFADHGSWL